MTQEIEGWTVEQDFGSNYATRVWRSPVFQEVTVDLDANVLAVDTEVGSGYGRESTKANIPTSVLVALLRKAGYEVSEPSSEEKP